MSTASNAEDSLATLGARALERIESLIPTIESLATRGSLISSAGVVIEAQRMKLWATNLDLWHEAHGSLDYRLRDAPTIRQIAESLLTELAECLDHRMLRNTNQVQLR